MANSIVTDLSAISSAAGTDVLYIVDVSDTTDSADGSSKKITVTNLLASQTLTDLTITGTNTVTAPDTENGIALTVTQNDTTNNPTAFNVANTGTGVGIDLDQTGNGTALEVDNDGTGHGAYIHQDGVLASTKYGLWVYSNAAQTNAELVFIEQDNASSDKDSLKVQNDGTGYGINIDQNGNGGALYVDNAGTSNGVNIQQSGVLSSAYALYVYSNAIQNASPLAKIHQDNASSDQDVLQVVSDGTGKSIFVDQNADAVGISIASEATTVTNYGIDVAVTQGARAAQFYQGANELGIFVWKAGTGASAALKIQNEGTGAGINIDQNGNGLALDIDAETSNDGSIVQITPAGASPSAFLIARNDDVNGNVVLRLGGSYLWVDATGDLRIHTSNPTSDTGVGTIVGTQS